MLDLVSSPHSSPDEKDNNNDYRYCQYKISSMVIRWKAQVLVVSRMMRGEELVRTRGIWAKSGSRWLTSTRHQGRLLVFLRDDKHHVKPLDYIGAAADLDYNAAIGRVVPRIDLSALASRIDSIPREAYGMPMMPAVVARFHKESFRIRLEEGLLPALEVAQR